MRSAFSPKSSAMTAVRALIMEIAGPLPMGSRVKTALGRVAAATGLSERRVRAFWNGEARTVLAAEMDSLRRAAAENRKTNDARIRMAADFEALAERLAATDPAFFGGDIARLRDDAARLRRMAVE